MEENKKKLILLYMARSLRGIGDGFATLVLTAYLIEIGFTAFQIGVVSTAALLGTAVTTLIIGLIGPKYDVRTLLLICAALMVVTGIAIPNVHAVALMALISFIGTINPTTGDIGVHVPLEHASLAHTVSDKMRTRIFARYSLIGALSISAGSLAAATPDYLAGAGFSKMQSLQLMFYVYAALGLASAILYGFLPANEVKDDEGSRRPLEKSRWTVYKLAALFSLDSFAGGFTVQSLLALSPEGERLADELQHLGHVLADLAQSVVAAAWAGRGQRIDNALPRQMLRQRPAGRLAALERWHRNLVGCHLRRGLGLRGVLLQIGKLQLELVQQCSALRGLSELLVPQLPDRELELLDQQCPRLRLRFRGQPGCSLGAQHRLQRDHIVGERIIGAHRRPENHKTQALSGLPIVLSIQIPAISRPPAVATCVAASASRCPPADSQAGPG